MYGDAASIDCLGWRDTFVRAGIEAPIYARHHDAHHAAICAPLSAYRHRPDDVILFHYTTWTETADFLLRQGHRLVLMYHNVTPPEFFAQLDEQAEKETRRGREQLTAFAPLTVLAAAKSQFSRRDLVAAGFGRTCVVPVRIDFDTLDRERNVGLERQVASTCVGVLTVGRVVANKCIEDLIKAFAYYRDRVEPRARLYCVGAHDPRGAYQIGLDWLVRRIGLGDAVRFTGQVPHADRGAYYRACRVFVTMSEHEGFCAPIVEAMHLGLPVIGFDSSAIPETMADAGVLIRRKRCDVIAETIALLAQDTSLRHRLIAKGHEQAARFRRERIEADFAAALTATLPGP